MKLLSLNTWGAKVRTPFQQFIEKKQSDVDIFCFQEVFDNYQGEYDDLFTVKDADPNLFQNLSHTLTNYSGYFCPVFKNLYGLAIFAKNNVRVLEHGSVLIYENKNFPDPNNEDADHNRKMQWIITQDEREREYLIINVHGHWVPGNKVDNVARIKQSEIILDFTSQYDLPTIICGDFNLRPDTKSIAILEKKFQNLIKKYDVKTTRTSLYTRSEKFADYIFVSEDIIVKQLVVLEEEVSDHGALLLDFQ
jgi:endonuclease/exonuclease/phosphatase family metal-dependent hydrolase